MDSYLRWIEYAHLEISDKNIHCRILLILLIIIDLGGDEGINPLSP